MIQHLTVLLRVLTVAAFPSVAPHVTSDEPEPKPYNQVVTGDAQTRRGLFITHRIGARLLYEIPRAVLGKDMWLTSRIVRTSESTLSGANSNGRIIRWEQRGQHILIYQVDLSGRVDSTTVIARGVEKHSYPVILVALPIQAYGPDSAPVIDVTHLFATPIREFEGPQGGSDPDRSFLESVRTFPENIEVEATLTLPGGGPDGATVTRLHHWSMLKLPDHPMQPRLADPRLSYLSLETIDYNDPERPPRPRKFIKRFRLECSARREGPLCYPVKPITFYVAPEMPPWLVPWVKRAVMRWEPALEMAGFKQGIVVKDPPSKAEDPDWSAEDARYSVIQWVNGNGFGGGGTKNDPRTGETLQGVAGLGDGYLRVYLRNMYWAEAGAMDPRALRVPFPDSLMGRLVQAVLEHEVGHALGFDHNMKASAMYPLDSIRNKDFVHRMGFTPSVMDYAYFNWIAQPEDRMALDDLIFRIGPYDMWAVHWGYAPIPAARTPEEEWPTLDRWAREQDTHPWLRYATLNGRRFSGNGNTLDVRENMTQQVGDAEPVRAARLGLKNLRRLVPLLLPATTHPEGDARDLQDLNELYDAVVDQWANEVRTPIVLIAGIETQEKSSSQPGPRYIPVSGVRQREALRFLLDEVLQPPTFLLDQHVLARIGPDAGIGRLSEVQQGIIGELLDVSRIRRLVEIEATAGQTDDIYPALAYLTDVQRGVWSELAMPSVRVNIFRRRVQGAYLGAMAQIVEKGGTPGDANADVGMLVRSDLQSLHDALAAALGKSADPMTHAYLAESLRIVDHVLHPSASTIPTRGAGD